MRFDQQVKLCQKDTSDISILYPVNLALLQQFFNESQLTEILANTSFNKPVLVKIPSFKIYEHKMSKLFAKDDKESLNLKKMAERTKKDQVIFSTLAESLVDGEITIDEEVWPKKEDVMSLIALTVGGINIIAIIWLIYKVRILSAAILMSTRLPQVSSLRLQYTLPITTTPSSWSDILNENLKWDHGVFVISFLTFGGLLVLLYSHFMKRPRNTRICLEITTGFECVLLDVMNLPLCPSYFTIRYPDSITDFKIKGLLSPRLFVNWPNFQVTNKITAHRIMLPASVPISLISARRLKRILSQSFCAHVIIAHHDIASPIQLTTPTAPTDPPLKPLTYMVSP